MNPIGYTDTSPRNLGGRGPLSRSDVRKAGVLGSLRSAPEAKKPIPASREDGLP